MGGKTWKGLIDTGCTKTIARTSVFGKKLRGTNLVTNFSGDTTVCGGTGFLDIVVNRARARVEAIEATELLVGVDIVLGMDIIKKLGPIKVVGLGTVDFHARDPVASVAVGEKIKPVHTIEDKDFKACFDGVNWTVVWKWKNGEVPTLKNTVAQYDHMNVETRAAFEKEVELWIEEGILMPWEGEVDGLLPLMAVEQPTKNKVRPVMDFRELNNHVECHTGGGEIDICCDKLREWRRTKGELELVDLQKAYLQIRVAEDMWRHQVVKFKGTKYSLTRLGFGLNVAPKIMSMILNWVLGQDLEIKDATSSYIDDVLVNTTKVSSTKVAAHLERYGLKSKPPEKLEGGAALGLKLKKMANGCLGFSRGNQVPEVTDQLTRRELFSICGKMTGHYPVGGWLRVACSYIKRAAVGVSWDDEVGDRARNLLTEVRERMKADDPVKGAWTVPSDEMGTVWCDASGLATGAVLEIGGVVVEDRAWLRKSDDFNHINVAELDAVARGVNMAVDWGIQQLHIKTDSSSVKAWVQLTLNEDRPIKTKGAAEVLIKRRLGVLKSLIGELDMRVTVELVETSKNKADALTRVPKHWLKQEKNLCSVSLVSDVHEKSHMGVERTLYLARKLNPEVTRSEVKNLVRACEECQSINPAPVRHEEGVLSVGKNWSRIAVDVTHYRGIPYLSIVDCGPGRFAIWREVKRETARCVYNELHQIFLERGPVDEIILDNAASFRSNELQQLFEYWRILPFFRAAHRPSGNSIVERHHRSIKSWSEKAGIEPVEAVYWYNVTPRRALEVETVPQSSVHSYTWRLPLEDPEVEEKGEAATLQVGDEVWVKPGSARCTMRWSKGKITGVNSRNNVSVDGMPRHILDVRRVYDGAETDGGASLAEAVGREEEAGPAEIPRRSGRIRRPPQWLSDIVTH